MTTNFAFFTAAIIQNFVCLILVFYSKLFNYNEEIFRKKMDVMESANEKYARFSSIYLLILSQ